MHVRRLLIPSRVSCERTRVQSRGSRPQQDDGRPHEADAGARDVPAVWTDTLYDPEPEQGGDDVDAAVGRVGPSGRITVDERQQVGEQGQRDASRNEPPDGFVQAKPRPEGEAACDLGDRGTGISKKSSSAEPVTKRLPCQWPCLSEARRDLCQLRRHGKDDAGPEGLVRPGKDEEFARD